MKYLELQAWKILFKIQFFPQLFLIFQTDEAAILAFSEMSLEIIDKEQGLVILKDLLRLCGTIFFLQNLA